MSPMWHLKSSPIFVNTVRKIKALKNHGMNSWCYHIISSNVRSFKKFVHNNFLVLFERLKTWTLVRLLSQCTYLWFYFIFTCIGRVNFHCPLNECLTNINKYITVFTSILWHWYKAKPRGRKQRSPNRVSSWGLGQKQWVGACAWRQSG